MSHERQTPEQSAVEALWSIARSLERIADALEDEDEDERDDDCDYERGRG